MKKRPNRTGEEQARRVTRKLASNPYKQVMFGVEAESDGHGGAVLTLVDIVERRKLYHKYGRHNVQVSTTDLLGLGFPRRALAVLQKGYPVRVGMPMEAYEGLITSGGFSELAADVFVSPDHFWIDKRKNHWVLIEDVGGAWATQDGARFKLYSVNAIRERDGRIRVIDWRWPVWPYMNAVDHQHVIEHFGLVDANTVSSTKKRRYGTREAFDEEKDTFDGYDDENEDDVEWQCSMCGGPVIPMGQMGNRLHGRCRNCGMMSSTVVGEDEELEGLRTRRPR